MLSLLRRKARSPIIQAAVVIIILVFILWVPQMGGNAEPDTVVTVNGESISSFEFQRRYEDTMSRYREQFEGAVPPELIEALGIREQVLNQMVQERLLLQSARDTGLPVTPTEVQRTVQSMGEFTENGQFSIQRYREILAASRISVHEFEAGIRTDLLKRKIQQHLMNFAQVSDEEVRERFHRDHDEVRLAYLRLNAGDFRAGLEPDREEIEAHYQEYGDLYRAPPQVRLDYLLFSADDVDMTVDDEELAAYYEENRDLFETPEQRRASHVLIRSDADAPAEARQRQRQQAESVLELARQGENFRELALLYSEDASAPDGDLGFFRRGEMLDPLEEAVFAMEPGEISEIVETSLGFHVIRLEEIAPAQHTTLEDSRDEIRRQLLQDQGRQIAFERADKVYENILTTGSLDRGAQEAGISLQSTGLFPQDQPPENLRRHPEAVTAAFDLNQGELSSIITTEVGYAIIYVQERQEPQVPPLEEVEDQVRADLIDRQAEEAARREAENILAAAGDDGADLGQLATAKGYQVRESGWYSRTTVDAAELPSRVARTGLTLTQEHPVPAAVEPENGSFYVIKLQQRRPASEELFARWAEPIRNNLLMAKQETMFDTWLQHQFQTSEIRVTTEDLGDLQSR